MDSDETKEKDPLTLAERAHNAVAAAGRIPSNQLKFEGLKKLPIDGGPLRTFKPVDQLQPKRPEIPQHILAQVPPEKREEFINKVEHNALGAEVKGVTPSGEPIFGQDQD